MSATASRSRQRSNAGTGARTSVLVVTGHPPDVHCDPDDAMIEAPPGWHLKSFCELCNARFGFVFHRRHHCRNCGKSVCGAHSLSRLVIYHLGFKHPERVCDICYDAYREASRGYPTYLERRLQAIFGAELYA